MKKDVIIDVFVNICIGLVGLWILINPGIGIDFVRFYLGLILIIAAVVLGVIYYRSKNKEFLKVLQAAALAIIGVLLLLSFRLTVSLIGVILIVWMLIEAIFAVNKVFIYKKHDIKIWPMMLAYAVLAFALAVYILLNFHKGQVTFIQMAGLFAFIKAIAGVADAVLYRRIYDKEDPKTVKEEENIKKDEDH